MTVIWYGGFVWILTWIVGMLIGYVCGKEEAKQTKEKKPAVRWYEQ